MRLTSRVLGVVAGSLLLAACSSDNAVSSDDAGVTDDGGLLVDGSIGSNDDGGVVTGTDAGHVDGGAKSDASAADGGGDGGHLGDAGDAGHADAAVDAGPPPASCMDGVKNGTETAIDCGGGVCAACADGLGCATGTDCASKVCDPGALTCTASACNDGVKNGQETGTDCGGPTCGACATGQGCVTGADCLDKVCDPMTSTCTVSACNDGVKNGQETGVDCGGPTCGACADGQGCATGADCADKVCDPGTLTCSAPACNDGVKNGTETAVDCGGPTCAACADGLACLVPGDCAGGVCMPATMTCSSPSCTDGVKNGQETDIDCGGPTCGRCDKGQSCLAGTDCAYAVCGAGNVCSGAVSCSGGGNGKATCGPAGNEDCCTTLPVPGGAIGAGANAWSVSPYRLDKYEITVARMRAFLVAKGWNLRGAPPAPGAGAHAKIPGSGWVSTWNDRLPVSQTNVLNRVGVNGGNAVQDSGVSDCFGGEDATTWTTNASVNDQKAANCFDWYSLFAFCAWDGGYLPTDREWQYAAQGGAENRTYAFGSASATVPKVGDWLPNCVGGVCQNPNAWLGAAYTSYATVQTVDAAYPTFLQAPGLYVVHGFCTNAGNRDCFSYSGANANNAFGAVNAAHVAPPGQKLDIAKWGQHDMSGNLIEWTLDNSVNINAGTGRQQTEAACVGADCANLDFVDYHVAHNDPNGNAIVGDMSIPGRPAWWRNWGYDVGQPNHNGANYDLDARYQQDGGRVMRGGSWEIAHPVNVSSRYGNYPVYRSYYAAGARCARPF